MSDPTRIDASTLTVLLDLRNPQSYLALSPAIALGRERGLDINWLPLTVPPLKAPSTPGPADDRGIRHRRHRAHAIAREIETYGRARGLVLRELYRDADAGALHLGWLWLRDRSTPRLEAFLAEAFRAYWSLELDPSRVSETSALVASIGDDARAFEAWSASDGPGLAKSVADALDARGLCSVPGYLVDGEFFLGRQHLPMIRWILDGRHGPGPI
jgi:2-hydroxychromene-2-carboxylate isomerase